MGEVTGVDEQDKVLLDACEEVLPPHLFEQVHQMVGHVKELSELGESVVELAREGTFGMGFLRCGCSVRDEHSFPVSCHHDCDCTVCELENALKKGRGDVQEQHCPPTRPVPR